MGLQCAARIQWARERLSHLPSFLSSSSLSWVFFPVPLPSSPPSSTATLVALHNGGGVGWGESTNGGFLLVLDGTDDAERRARLMLDWDVNNGVARRAWGRNSNAQLAISEAEKRTEGLSVTQAHIADAAVVAAALNQK